MFLDLSYLGHVFDQGDGQFDVRADVDERQPRDDRSQAQAHEHCEQHGRNPNEPLAVATHLLVENMFQINQINLFPASYRLVAAVVDEALGYGDHACEDGVKGEDDIVYLWWRQIAIIKLVEASSRPVCKDCTLNVAKNSKA